MTVQIRNRLNKIETALAGMEPEIPRRHLTPEEAAELDTLARTAPGGDPFGHPFEKAMRWKELYFIKGYGYTPGELRKMPFKDSLAKALQKSRGLLS